MLLVIGLQSVQRTGVLSYPPQYGQSVPSEIATGAVRLEDRDAMEVLLLPTGCLACRAAPYRCTLRGSRWGKAVAR